MAINCSFERGGRVHGNVQGNDKYAAVLFPKCFIFHSWYAKKAARSFAGERNWLGCISLQFAAGFFFFLEAAASGLRCAYVRTGVASSSGRQQLQYVQF